MRGILLNHTSFVHQSKLLSCIFACKVLNDSGSSGVFFNEVREVVDFLVDDDPAVIGFIVYGYFCF